MTHAARTPLTLLAGAIVVSFAPARAPAPAVALATSAAAPMACTLIPEAQLHSVLGLSKSLTERDDDNTAGVPGSPAVHNTLCVVGVWDGPQPSNAEQRMQLARSGHGAEVTIQTWTPNKSSPDVKRWLTKDYDELTGDFQKGSALLPGNFSSLGFPTQHLEPPRLGHDGVGVTVTLPEGYAKGLSAAAACWWDDKTSSAVCLAVEEATSRPVVKHLEDLAKIAVPNLLH